MPRFAVVHETTYRYASRVSSSYGQLCMLPREFADQRCLSATVAVDPVPSDMRERVDFFGNRVSYFTVEQPHDVLRITARSEVDVSDEANLLAQADQTPLAAAVTALDELEGEARITAAQYVTSSPRISLEQQVRDYAKPSFSAGRPVVECLHDLVGRIHRDFRFNPGVTTVTSTVADLFAHGAGVCQDFAHLAVACIRAQGLPACYVSGYLETNPPVGRPKVVGADVSHAWASALIPTVGWIGIDPTNDQFVNDRYITTGWGRDYGDVAPLRGVIFSNGGKAELDVSVDVSRLG